jgi:hypothetical protein
MAGIVGFRTKTRIRDPRNKNRTFSREQTKKKVKLIHEIKYQNFKMCAVWLETEVISRVYCSNIKKGINKVMYFNPYLKVNMKLHEEQF